MEAAPSAGPGLLGHKAALCIAQLDLLARQQEAQEALKAASAPANEEG